MADILGNSPVVVRKHYGKWSRGRQDNIEPPKSHSRPIRTRTPHSPSP